MCLRSASSCHLPSLSIKGGYYEYRGKGCMKLHREAQWGSQRDSAVKAAPTPMPVLSVEAESVDATSPGTDHHLIMGWVPVPDPFGTYVMSNRSPKVLGSPTPGDCITI